MAGSDSTRGDSSTVVGEGLEAAPALASAAPARRYLMVFDGDSAALAELPAAGELVVGRAEGVDLRLHDASVSRRHAAITLSAAGAQLADLDSQNGTRLNGERLTGLGTLVSGDLIHVGSVAVVYHERAPAAAVHPATLDAGQLRRRAEQELHRALAYQRPFSVAALDLGGAVDRARAALALTAALRPLDALGWSAEGHALVLLPEADADDADEAGGRLVAALAEVAPGARVGVASCPEDGCDLGALLAGARQSAARAAHGAVAASTETFRALELGAHRVVVADAAMLRLYELVERLAQSDLPVLVTGESGTGKELCAAALHHWSPRRQGAFVAVNCAALPETLVESELFGYERGAFSGAAGAKPGLLERAHGGTVLLDEMGELSAPVQAKLLRVLETRRLTRLGDVAEREVDLRIVAATNRDLAAEVNAGRFRQDLYFRLSGATLWIPPLRDRPRELALLAPRFLAAAGARLGRAAQTLTHGALQALAAYAWPGNVRELKLLMEYVAAAVPGRVVDEWHLQPRLDGAIRLTEPAAPAAAARLEPPVAGAPPGGFRPIEEELRELERGRMAAALAAAGGVQTRAAALIHMPLRTFQGKVKQYGLVPNDARRRG